MCESYVRLDISDLEAPKRFYDALLGRLGDCPSLANRNGICGHYIFRSPTGNFGITEPLNGQAITQGLTLHNQ